METFYFNFGIDNFPTEKTEFSFNISFSSYNSNNLGIGGINLESRGYDLNQSRLSVSSIFQYVFSPSAINSIKGGFWNTTRTILSRVGDVSIIVADSFTSGAL